MVKEVLKVRRFKVGYELRTELIDGSEFGCEDFIVKSSYSPSGDYIGDKKIANFLCKKKGIKPEKRKKEHYSCTIGFCEKEQKWYGWSHRMIYGFKIGDTVKEGDCVASSGLLDEYIAENPIEMLSLPIGFVAKTLDDCKKMAIVFADSVS